MQDYPIIFNNKNFSNIKNIINNLEIISLILDNDREKAKFQIKKMPYSLKKNKVFNSVHSSKKFCKEIYSILIFSIFL